jgi:hypothetical protein
MTCWFPCWRYKRATWCRISSIRAMALSWPALIADPPKGWPARSRFSLISYAKTRAVWKSVKTTDPSLENRNISKP